MHFVLFYKKIILRVLILLACVGVILFLSLQIFSGTAPSVSFEIEKPAKANEFYSLDYALRHDKIKNLPKIWNEEGEIYLILQDIDGIKEYEINMYEINKNEKILIGTQGDMPLDRTKEIRLKLPKPNITKESARVLYEVDVRDWSNANLFLGASVTRKFEIKIDKKSPEIEVLAHSPKIIRGGSGIVVFSAKDDNLQEVFITNGSSTFQVFKYAYDRESNMYYYASIFPWPLHDRIYSVTLIALDDAGNRTLHEVKLDRLVNVYIRKSNLKLKPDFLEGKMIELLSQYGEDKLDNLDNIARFKYLNEQIRQEDESKIFKALNEMKTQDSFINNEMWPFLPMKKAIRVGHFGDFRTYIYENEKISQSNHMGIDLASVRRAPIYSSNNGVVVLAERLGLYGNTIVIYHGLGLSSIYSHLTSFSVKLGDNVKAGQEIAKSGQSGWAFGDHLHFGILVHGHTVRPNEWLREEWINTNIFGILEDVNKYFQAKNIEILNK